MEIGFINLNQDALNRTNKLMQLLQGQGAIDELGLGRIRDFFSNRMFPGMSTLQTRAKYFLLLPALYAYLEKTKISGARDAREKIRINEIALTKRLDNGTPEDDKTGIIGAENLRKNGTYVKYDPTYVYQAGMETYGLIKTGGNLYRLLAERSNKFQNLPEKQRGNDEVEGDAEELTGDKTIFLTCGEPYDFKNKDPMPVSLTSREASFLRKQIVKTEATQGSLINFLLDGDLFKRACNYDFETLGEEVLEGNVPDELYETYLLARRYSRFAYLLRIRYAMLYDRAVGADEAAEKEKHFFDFLNIHKAEFTPEAVDEIIKFASSVQENTCKVFCREAARLVENEDWNGLDELLELREIEIKTLKRSKLRNAHEYEKGKAFALGDPLSFRWESTVSKMLKEISEGIKNE